MDRMEEVRFRRESSRLALFAVMVAVTTVANLIVVPMPPPLAQYDLSPILIYSLAVLVSPITSGLAVGLAQGIGTLYKTMVFGWPPIFVVGAVLVRGFEAVLISSLAGIACSNRRRAVTGWEIAAMVVGVVWETLGFFTADAILFGVGYAMISLLTIADAMFIPVAVGVVVAVRRAFNVKKLM
jgi:hypothetical protein